MKQYFNLLLICLFFLSTDLYATNLENDNDCAFLSIMISNHTQENCRLTKKDIVHGNMSSGTQVPVLIQSGSSSYPFELRQTLYGPDVVVSYDCGEGSKITFESQQNVCYFSAGTISGQVRSNNNLHATYTKEEGSAWWGRHGSISWELTE